MGHDGPLMGHDGPLMDSVMGHNDGPKMMGMLVNDGLNGDGPMMGQNGGPK